MSDQQPAGAEAVLAGITAEGIGKAIVEFDRLGRGKFLEKYGFQRAHRYIVDHQGKQYDSKAIVGAARGYDRPDLGPAPIHVSAVAGPESSPCSRSTGFKSSWRPSLDVTLLGPRRN